LNLSGTGMASGDDPPNSMVCRENKTPKWEEEA